MKLILISFAVLFSVVASYSITSTCRSKICRSHLSATLPAGHESQETILFSGVKFSYPISASLRSLGIVEASPIQKVSIAPITSGLSCILHAQTGSGKTLAYLLPLLKRLIKSDGSIDMTPLQGLIVVPSKELAVQVAADITALLSQSEKLDCSAVEICLKTSNSGLDKVLAPIVVGTPFKILDALRASSPQLIEGMNYLVLDEVDRLMSSLSKYATSDEKREARNEVNPTVELVSLIVKAKIDANLPQMQVVAASATVGRPLRRDLFKLLQGGEEFGNLMVLRPASPEDEHGDETKRITGKSDVNEKKELLEAMPVKKSGSNAQSGSTRKVGIPTGIRHVAVLTRDDSSDLNRKVVAAKEKWVGECSKASRGLLFVPKPEDVKQIIGKLQFWGVKESQNLQKNLGIEVDSEVDQKKNQSGNNAKSPEDKAKESAELIIRAAKSRLGASSRTVSGQSADVAQLDARDLFVLPVSGSRGLHLQDVEYVIILQPPKTMDEYLHMAGRTGRAGNKVSTGTVISLVNFEELKRMQSWQTALDIDFEVEYE